MVNESTNNRILIQRVSVTIVYASGMNSPTFECFIFLVSSVDYRRVTSGCRNSSYSKIIYFLKQTPSFVTLNPRYLVILARRVRLVWFDVSG